MSKAQSLKTLFMNADSAVYDLVSIGPDTLIAVGKFAHPFVGVIGAVISTGEVFPLGNGLPAGSRREFILPSNHNLLYASINKSPYLMYYNLATQSEWTVDTSLGINNVITDIDTFNQTIAFAEGADGYTIVTPTEIHHYPARSGGSVACIVFDQDDGSVYIDEHYEPSFLYEHDTLFHVTDVGEISCKFGVIEKIYDLTDMIWDKGKIFFTSYSSSTNSPGYHGVFGSYDPLTEEWVVVGTPNPEAMRCGKDSSNLYITGWMVDVSQIETGMIAKWNGNMWSKAIPNNVPLGGEGLALVNTTKYLAVSGIVVGYTYPTWGKTQIVVYGDLPTGTNEIYPIPSSLILFPNPATDKVFINGCGRDEILTISDILGTILRKEKVVDSRFELDVSDLPNGIYMILSNYSGNQKLMVLHQ